MNEFEESVVKSASNQLAILREFVEESPAKAISSIKCNIANFLTAPVGYGDIIGLSDVVKRAEDVQSKVNSIHEKLTRLFGAHTSYRASYGPEDFYSSVWKECVGAVLEEPIARVLGAYMIGTQNDPGKTNVQIERSIRAMKLFMDCAHDIFDYAVLVGRNPEQGTYNAMANKRKIAEKGRYATEPFKGQGRVLVAEDNIGNGEFIADWLNTFGYESVYVHDGQAALEQLERAKQAEKAFDVVVCSGVLTQVSSPVLISTARNQYKTAAVAVTGSFDHDPVVTNLNKAGATYVVPKPYQDSTMLPVIVGSAIEMNKAQNKGE